MALTPEQIAIVKSTAPILREHGQTITSLFYKTLLSENPALKSVFSLRAQRTGEQSRALADAVFAYSAHIDNLPALSHAVERIAHKHASLGVAPAQYAVVGEYLMRAIGEVLGEALTPEIHAAWVAAYGQLADVFIQREEALYVEGEEAEGGWRGWRSFKIVKEEPVADELKNLYLESSDGKPICGFLPGQYISLQMKMPVDGLLQSRQYSLSEPPAPGGKTFRITVKKEPVITEATPDTILSGEASGVVSNMLFAAPVGTEVDLSHPQGEFFVDPADSSKASTPLVLISRGVGAAPLISILRAVKAAGSATQGRPTSWIHGARSASGVCFGEEAKIEGVTSIIATKEDGKGLDIAALSDAELFAGDSTAEYYICGPEEWMVAVRASLMDKGIAKERCFLELFRTGDVA